LKVLLIKPNGVADEIIPPISLGWLATQVRDRHAVTILDALKENLSSAEIARVAAEGCFDIVGFQAWSKDIHEIKRTAGQIKKIRPESKIIVGGIHPTMLPEGTMRFFGETIDFGFKGEGEIGFPLFVEAVASKSLEISGLSGIPGLIWRDNGEIRVNENGFNEDLDSIGWPAWDLIPPASYPRTPHGAFYRNFPIAPIVVTRGCPFPCTFCSAKEASGGRLRKRSLDNVLGELLLHNHRFGVREFQIEDDNFTLDRDYVEQFCRDLQKEGIRMTWSFPNGVRLDTLDSSILKIMKMSGCYALNFGIESGSPRILEMINKRMTVEKIEQQLHLAHDAGFELGGFFVIGFPTETPEEIEQTIDFARSLPLDRIGVFYFQPFPGTALYKLLVSQGEIPADWADRQQASLHTLTYISPTLTEKMLRNYKREMLRRFYGRPRQIWGLLSQIRSPSHFYYMFKRSLRWMRA
jgi:anaerobic magnesium-protoporphyrin IX monomethyl ester cyclase